MDSIHKARLRTVMNIEAEGDCIMFRIVYRGIRLRIWMDVDSAETFVDKALLDTLYTNGDISGIVYGDLADTVFNSYYDCLNTIKRSIDSQY